MDHSEQVARGVVTEHSIPISKALMMQLTESTEAELTAMRDKLDGVITRSTVIRAMIERILEQKSPE